MSATPPDDDEKPEGYTYGLTNTGDLRLNPVNQPTEITGAEAIVQDLKVALLTPKGSDPLRPEYGLDYLQAAGTNDQALRGAIIDAIGPEADPRVRNITQIAIDRPGGDRENTRVVISLTLRDGSAVAIEFSPQFA